ncbi:hypothetical protein [Streptomyces mirabilis]|uniref:hypothetical protein n=1 Tax=Streptomyces mirabilis TaxID=68239 RepID=UPI0036B794C6
MWLQLDWGEGPKVAAPSCSAPGCPGPGSGVVIPAWEQTLGPLVACLDATLRRLGRVPCYVLADNPRTVTIDRVAGIAVHHPEIAAAAKSTCEPFDPKSKDDVEATVRIAKADLVLTTANLRREYGPFAALAAE